MDFYELLKQGLTAEEISNIAMKEMSVAQAKLEEEQEAQKLKEKALKDRQMILDDARAHLISAIGLYNEVFKFMEFNDEKANEYADVLKEMEQYFLEHPNMFKMMLEMGVKPSPKVNVKTSMSTKDLDKLFNDIDWDEIINLL